jgi:uncharacterized DUF497 family protein
MHSIVTSTVCHSPKRPGKVMATPDNRRSYGEERYIAATPIGARLHVVVFTIRSGTLRIISLRKANRREIKRYETQD